MEPEEEVEHIVALLEKSEEEFPVRLPKQAARALTSQIPPVFEKEEVEFSHRTGEDEFKYVYGLEDNRNAKCFELTIRGPNYRDISYGDLSFEVSPIEEMSEIYN